MFAEIEAFALDIFANPQAGDGLGDVEGDGRTGGSPYYGDQYGHDLDHELCRDAVIIPGNLRVGDGGADRTNNAADAVNAEYVERIVKAELGFQLHHEIAADDGGKCAKDYRTKRPAIARCWRYRY